MAEDEGKQRAASPERHGGAGGTFAAGLIIGGLLGAGLALLLAPQAGEDTRRLVSRRAKRLIGDAKDRYDDTKRRLRRAREERPAAGDDEPSAG